jgi:hypothetical protein
VAFPAIKDLSYPNASTNRTSRSAGDKALIAPLPTLSPPLNSVVSRLYSARFNGYSQ